MEDNKTIIPVDRLDEADGIFGDATNMTEEQSAMVQSLAEAKAEQSAPVNYPRFIRPTSPMAKEYKVGRNDPCPCGSGKKYKKCCLDTGTYEGYTR